MDAKNPLMALEFTTSYTKDAVDVFRYYKRLGERAIEQVPDAALIATLDSESNSIALIVKHLSGNMRSRWRDFLTTDGEKPDRNRDSGIPGGARSATRSGKLWRFGSQAGNICSKALVPMTDADLGRTVKTISGNEPHSVSAGDQPPKSRTNFLSM